MKMSQGSVGPSDRFGWASFQRDKLLKVLARTRLLFVIVATCMVSMSTSKAPRENVNTTVTLSLPVIEEGAELGTKATVHVDRSYHLI